MQLQKSKCLKMYCEVLSCGQVVLRLRMYRLQKQLPIRHRKKRSNYWSRKRTHGIFGYEPVQRLPMLQKPVSQRILRMFSEWTYGESIADVEIA